MFKKTCNYLSGLSESIRKYTKVEYVDEIMLGEKQNENYMHFRLEKTYRGHRISLETSSGDSVIYHHFDQDSAKLLLNFLNSHLEKLKN